MTTDNSTSSGWRLRVYPLALVVVLAAALLFAVLTYDIDHPTSRLGGDYPSFYGAGAIARAGDWDELYSAERQSVEQEGLIDDAGGYLYFSYPPFVAGAYSVLASLAYRWSFLIHTILMAFALFAAIRLLGPWLQRAQWPPLALFALAVAFYPLLRAIPGGQNTALSLLLLAAAIRLDLDEAPFLSGLALAALLFKPQFGVVIVPLLIVGRRWRVLVGWATGAVILFVTSTLLMGGTWLAEWWEQASAFREQNVAANGVNFVSLPGFFENLLGAGTTSAFLFGYGLAALFGTAVVYYWWQHPQSHALERYALAGAAVVLAAPQTLYYDAGILLLGLVAAFALLPRRAVLLIAMIVLSWSHIAADDLGWSPLGPLSWAAAAWLAWWLTANRETEATSV
ncbi:MAG: glycosyltransferase family 87 protein [Acidimicrobiia bacterium]|nr:glycosyltransferase family 87 protein [Acidimicrobiia bacterium]